MTPTPTRAELRAELRAYARRIRPDLAERSPRIELVEAPGPQGQLLALLEERDGLTLVALRPEDALVAVAHGEPAWTAARALHLGRAEAEAVAAAVGRVWPGVTSTS